MSRRKRKRTAPPVRIPEEVTAAVDRIVDSTGWPAGKALMVLVNAGADAMSDTREKLPAYQKLLAAAVEHHRAELAARQSLATTSAKLREARKALLPPDSKSVRASSRQSSRKGGRSGT